MIKFENTEVEGWRAALRGMRNPMNSWDKADSNFCDEYACGCCHCYKAGDDNECEKHSFGDFVIGPNDYMLATQLAKAGSDHSKFLRMINVTVDITAPLYWWKEFDTYKVGTVRNSCSTMHKIHAKRFELDDFSHEHINSEYIGMLQEMIIALNDARDDYLYSEKNEKYDRRKIYWWQMIQLLPSSYNQRATVQLNYQVLRNIYHSDRKHHKLDEWREGFMQWIESLPYSELITDHFREGTKKIELVEE